VFAHRYSWVILTAACLLLIAASRILRLSEMGMNPDEIWSVWQTFGTPMQIIQWTPNDWPPGYYLTLGAWRAFNGQHPIVLRYLSVLAFLIGSSFLLRVGRRLCGMGAGLLVMLAYAALGYGIFLSTEVRGYALLLGLLPIAFWLMLRYFDHPTWRRGVPLALSMVGMFYISVTSIGAFLMLGIYTLMVYRRQIWRWWLPGLLAGVLALPEIMSKAGLAVARTEATQTLTLPPLLEALRNIYWEFAGYESIFLIWAIVFIAATALILRRRSISYSIGGLLAWAVGGPILMYLLNSILGFFSVRYSWWIMLGIAAWTAWGLAYLPRKGILAATALLSAMLFVPIPFSNYTTYDTLSPLEANFIWLKDHMVTGDVFVADPRMKCGSDDEWYYWIRTYFPMGLTFVENPANYRRVWYITTNGQEDASLKPAVQEGRVAGRFVGPPECLFRLYEAPPDPVGVLYENGMRFHGMDAMEGERPWSAPLVRHEGETVRLRLWWSVDRSPTLDYSINTYVLRNFDSLFVEVNGPPQVMYPEGSPRETSRWKPGQYYIEERDLTLPYLAGRGPIGIYMVVYDWGNGKRVPAPGVDANNALLLRILNIMSF